MITKSFWSSLYERQSDTVLSLCHYQVPSENKTKQNKTKHKQKTKQNTHTQTNKQSKKQCSDHINLFLEIYSPRSLKPTSDYSIELIVCIPATLVCADPDRFNRHSYCIHSVRTCCGNDSWKVSISDWTGPNEAGSVSRLITAYLLLLVKWDESIAGALRFWCD